MTGKKNDRAIQDRFVTEAETLKVLTWEQWEVLQKYRKITSALNEYPMTVKEISNLYPELKSLKSIYRYVERLEENGIIQVVGYRDTSKARNPERLYGRTAKLFFVESRENASDAAKDWEKHKGMPFVEKVAAIVGASVNKDVDRQELEKLHDALQEYIYVEHKELVTLLSSINEKESLIATYRDIPLDMVNTVNEYALLIITYLKHQHFFDTFKTIFS